VDTGSETLQTEEFYLSTLSFTKDKQYVADGRRKCEQEAMAE
jgi:hypothetical protein